MSQVRFGRLRPVKLRDVWKSEARDFTPWLAQPDNLSLLGETIGMSLVLQAIEHFVGPFRADVVCRDPDNRVVLIENQLEPTDHSHLGQILTYAAGVDAFTFVWIASEFRPEHRAAFDRLNETTQSDIRLFGLEIELWQIGDSAIAPNFRIVSQPNEAKRIQRAVESGASAIGQMQFEYWTEFSERFLSSFVGIRPSTPRPQNYFLMSLPNKGFQLNTFMDTKAKNIGVALMIDSRYFRHWYAWFETHFTQLETQLGALKVVEAKNQPYVELRLTDTDPKDRNHWDAQHTWLLQTSQKFVQVFQPYLDTLNTDGDLAE